MSAAAETKQPVFVESERSCRRSRSRFWLGECAGALGDIGTFVPLAVGMVQVAGLDGGTILVTAGVVNILSGVAFRIPIAVQPMKAIAALALAGLLTGPQVVAAGLCVGLCMTLLGALRLMEPAARLIPEPVVRALQCLVALELLRRGLEFCFGRPMGRGSSVQALGVLVGLIWLWLMRKRLEWAAIVLLLVGLIWAAWQDPALMAAPALSLWRPRLAAFDTEAAAGVWLGGLPQIPLTFLNSVLAVTALGMQLFPEQAHRLAPSRVAFSVGLMNLCVSPLGAMPLCHGSGGLAGQYALGARTGVSVILLGGAKLVLGLFFSEQAVAWMKAFPHPVLGMFLVVAGASLARAGRAWTTRAGVATLVLMAAVYYATGGLLVAFLAAWLLCWAMGVRAGLDRRGRKT